MYTRFLTGYPIDLLTVAFNEAFSDYFVKVELTPEQMLYKIKQEDLIPDLSIGVFDGERLVAFVLNGKRDSLMYNGGTGVIPSYRGQHLIHRIYEVMPDLCAKEGIDRMVLEVLHQNEKAIHIYEQCGYYKTRELRSYAGPVPGIEIRIELQPETLNTIPFDEVQYWWDDEPSWPGARESVVNISNELFLAGIKLNGKLAGYTAIIKHNGRMLQLAVDPQHRRKGIGTALVRYAFMELEKETLQVLNVDGGNNGTNAFFEKIGWELKVKQWEMENVKGKM